MRTFLCALLLPACAAATLAQRAAAQEAPPRHVVIIVWDGLRPDSITDEATPTLAKLARDGVNFLHHHSAYPTSTEVNGTAIATGCYPGHSGLIGNREFRPAIDPFRSVATEDLQAIRIGDAATGGHYLRAPTLAELAHAAGWRTATTSTKGVVLLQDRAARPDAGDLAAESVELFSGSTLPASAAEDLARDLGTPFPREIRLPNVDQDAWTTRALTQALWKTDLPALSVLWLSDPDFTQHKYGPSSPQALKALASDDGNLAAVLDALTQRGWRDSTDVFVVSDHGFSTIGTQVDVTKELVKAGFDAHSEFHHAPTPGQILTVGLGGSVYLYVVGHDEATTARLTRFLQSAPFAGVLFTRAKQPGAFPLDLIHLDSPDAPDVVVALRWTDEKNANGLPGTIYADGERKPGQGTHATLSRYDLHNTLVANGPDFRPGFRDELPSGNTDLAPTIAHLLGLPGEGMDGRILSEALVHPPVAEAPPAAPATERQTESASADGENWQQYLQITRYDHVTYFDEGNVLPPPPSVGK